MSLCNTRGKGHPISQYCRSPDLIIIFAQGHAFWSGWPHAFIFLMIKKSL